MTKYIFSQLSKLVKIGEGALLSLDYFVEKETSKFS